MNSELVCLVPLVPQVNMLDDEALYLSKISDKMLQPRAMQDAAY